ncbi:hypothetical protein PALB_37310 [Pseudoalteromonas luteoviolacea B = ATCC 29581]|nr:hypothetical protein PALB_37310 [Pseudoalteromonas luteoviolacea B = ATCC 29581]
MPKLFSYGTLQQTDVQLTTFGRILDGQHDELVGFEIKLIEIRDPTVIKTSGKTHHPILIRSGDKNAKVSGMVFDITDNELDHADKYEVDDYIRVETKLNSGQFSWVYVAKSS